MPRDEFSEKNKKVLCDRVGGKCSKPDCRIITFGPHEVFDKRTSLGEAAHITAAAKGGPRYDESLTSEARKGVNNGMWLCSTHAREIDANPDKYPVELLYAWKAVAEKLADDEIGKRSFSQKDVDVQKFEFIKQLVQPAFSKNEITSVIHSVHQGAVANMEALDPRFKVTSTFDGKKTLFRIDAKDTCELRFKVLNDNGKDFANKFDSLLAHGKGFSIPTDNIKFSGSQLFESMIKPGGTFSMSFIGKPAVFKLAITERDTYLIYTLDDVHGELINGELSTEFRGDVYNGLFSISIKFNHTLNSFNLNLNINWQNWNGLPLNKLPYFSKLLKFYNSFVQCSSFNIGLEIEGESILNVKKQLDDPIVHSGRTMYLLKYIDAARTISKLTGTDINFDIEKIEYDEKEYDFVLNQASLLTESRILIASDIDEKITISFIVNDKRENLEQHIRITEPFITRTEFNTIKVKLFDHWIDLPTKRITNKNVVPRITPSNTDQLKVGDEFHVELIPTQNFECLIEYLID